VRRGLKGAIGIAACLWLALAAGCGGAAKDASAPASPSNAKAESYPGGAGPTPGMPPPPPSTAATAPPTGSARRTEAMADFERATRDLEAASNECGTACRALASLERATVRICELAEEPADVERCEDAKKKLRNARDRVRASCNACPGGPSVDRDAPIPSR